MIRIARFTKYFPIVEQLRGYSSRIFQKDLIASITVGVVLIPQAMAYALLAGVPPVYGLYACLLPLLIYALFGTSRQISIGPVAVTSILIMTGISQLAPPFSPEYVQLVITTGLCIGIFQLVLGFLRMGFLVNLISQPVISGFISAAAIIIIVSQLEGALGLIIPDFAYTYQRLWYVIQNLLQSNGITTILCLLSIGLILGCKKWKPSFPAALFCLILFGCLTMFLHLDQMGVAIIGEVPAGLPVFILPTLSFALLSKLWPTILTVAMIGYIGSIGIAKAFEMKERDHTVRPNQELFALGLAKILGSFLQAIPSSGSYSRSAINNSAGGKTTVASVLTAIIILLSLLFLTPFFYYIPKAVLAAIILTSVLGLINYKEAIYLIRVRRRDFLVMLITFGATLFLGIERGILIGVVLSFVFLQYYSARPHIAELVRIPNTEYYRNVNRFPEAKVASAYVIIRFDNQLYFGNTAYFKQAIMNAIIKRETPPLFIILDSSNMHDIDSTGLHAIEDLQLFFKNHGAQLLIVGAIGPVRDFLKRSGFTEDLGPSHYFVTITEAVRYAQSGKRQKKSDAALQYNERNSLFD